MSQPYIVSARKYRPQTFDTVVGQEHITTTLKNAIRNNQLAHAYLFCGPRGVGKTTCARILAKTINCENPTPDTEACGICPTCISFQNNTSFNVFELDAASNNSVDDIRALTDQVRFSPQQGRYKIYIIDEVHMLSAAAFNAFLKTLEEPPPYAIFILATTEKHKIIPTILSRCQIFDFKRITTHDTVQHLQSIAGKEGMVADEAALHVIAQKSEGCMRDSLSMLDRIASFTNGRLTYAGTMEHLNLLDADFYFRLTDTLLSQDVGGALLHLDAVLDKGFEGDVILNGLAEHLRNLLLCKDARMAKLLDVPNDHRKTYYEKAGQMPPSFILSALNVLNDTELGYKAATNKRLHAELCLIRLCYLLQAVALSEDPLKKKSDERGGDINTGSQPLPVMQSTAEAPVAYAPQVLQQPAYIPQVPAPETTVQIAPAAQPKQPSAQAETPEKMAPARAINANLLDDLDEPEDGEAAPAEILSICQDEVNTIWEAYRQKAQDENKAVVSAQLALIVPQCIEPDEVHLIAKTHMAESWSQTVRNDMLDFFRARTKVVVRITSEVREDEAHEAAQPAVLSKTDVFELLAKKNPALAQLKDGLNLQIEY